MIKKSSSKSTSNPVDKSKLISLLKGVILAYLITIPLFILFSLILSYTNFPENFISTAVMLTTIISVAIASSTASRNIQSKGWLVGASVGLLYMLILYIFSGLVYKNFSIGKYLVNMILICTACGSIGGIIGVNLKTGRRNRTKIKR